MTKIPVSDSASPTLDSTFDPRAKTTEKWMSLIARAEGISFLLLLFIAMPVKYLGDNPVLVRLLGPIHGGLFLLYLASAVVAARVLHWRLVHFMLAVLASVIPFGPFMLEAWLRRNSKLN